MIAWIASILSIAGAILNARKMKIGFVIWIISNLIWAGLSIVKKDYAQTLVWLVYTVISIYGLCKWSEDKKAMPLFTKRRV